MHGAKIPTAEMRENLFVMNEAVAVVDMRVQVHDEEDRAWSLHRGYPGELKNAGFVKVMKARPHIVIQHVLQERKPTYMQNRMKGII